MKILVLMPCDEKSVYMAAGIYKALPQKIREKTFAMPMFMDYLVQTKLVGNWVVSFYDALVSARKIYETAEEDLIIIGNVNKKDCSFDAVFNFQDAELDLVYKDDFLEKIKEMVADDEFLKGYVENMYTKEDSLMPLQNYIATADFLTAYLKTGGVEKSISKLNKEYEEKIANKK
jgi:hypothetical protein